MKKLLGILVLGLLWCNVAFAYCVTGDCKNGKGSYKFSNGAKYFGDFKKGNLHGQGSLTFPDGRKIVGQFKKNKINGYGTYTWPDGKKYVGEFKNDYMHGQGTLTFPDGKEVTGEFKKNLAHGQGTMILPDGKKYVGKFKNGYPDGKGTWTEVEPKTTKVYDIAGSIKIPIYINIVEIDEEGFKTITTEQHVRNDIKEANEIWKQANISFHIKEINKIKANTKQFSKNMQWIKKNLPKNEKEMEKFDKGIALGKKKYLKILNRKMQIYAGLINFEIDDSTNLLKRDGQNIFYLPKMLSTDCAFVFFPWSEKTKIKNETFMILGHSCPIVPWDIKSSYTLSHEMGHLLGLYEHSTRSGNLMESGGKGTAITNNQAKQFRDYYFKYLKKLFK